MPREITPAFYKEDINESTLPYIFYFGSAVVYDNKIHILGSSSSNKKTKHYSWNGTSWAEASTLPYNFYRGAGVVYNDKIHILGGYENETKHYSWNGTSWTEESTLPYDFYYGSAVVYNNKIHILGSYNNKTKHCSWDGTSWLEESTLPYNFRSGSVVIYNNKIHILGSGENNNKTKHYSWDGTSWLEESTLPYDFSFSNAVIYNNEIHILGSGENNNEKKHYSWNGVTWIEESTLPYYFYYGGAVIYNNKINILGGASGSSTIKHYSLEYYLNTNVNKVDFGEENLIDLTEDNLEYSSQLLQGLIAHSNQGNFIKGTRPAYFKENSSKYALICQQELQSEEGVDKDAIFLGGQVLKLRVPAGTNNVQLVALKDDGVTESIVTLTTVGANYRNQFYLKKIHYLTDRMCLIEHYNYTGDVATTNTTFRIILIKKDGSLVLGAASNWGVAETAALKQDVFWIRGLYNDGTTFLTMDAVTNTTANTMRLRGYRTYVNTATGAIGYSTARLLGNGNYYANTSLPDLYAAPNRGGFFVKYNNADRLLICGEYTGSGKNLTIDNTGTDMETVGVTNHHMLGQTQEGLVVTAKENDKLYLWSYDNASTANVFTKVNEFDFKDFGKYFKDTSTLLYSYYEGSAVIYNNKIHILGGYSNNTNHYSWNGTSWTKESTLPYEFYRGSAVVYDNKIHILGGYNSSIKHYSWDGTSWTEESTLPYSYYYGSAVVYNNKIHILGCYYNRTGHYSWDGTSWIEESTLPYNFDRGFAIVYDNKIHILGSYVSSNYTKHYSWNGTSWIQESTLPYDFDRGSAVVYDNRIHILGSVDSSSNTKHYSWNGTSWIQESTLPYIFYNGSAVVYDNKIHILGGDYIGYTKHYSFSSNYFNILSFANDVLLLNNGRRIQVTIDGLNELEPIEVQYAQCPSSRDQIGPESDPYNGIFIYGD